MKVLASILLILLLFSVVLLGQVASKAEKMIPATIDDGLRSELLEMRRVDQSSRANFKGSGLTDPSVLREISNLDLKNTRRLKEIINVHGWPTAEKVGKEAVQAAFLILQHSADWEFQRRMLPFVEASVERREISTHDFTLLFDRVRVHFGIPQRYGTQASIRDGKLVLDPIEEEESVDKRRSSLGLPPLEVYLKLLEDIYKVPVERKPRSQR